MASTTGVAVDCESKVMLPLPVQPGNPQATLSAWNINTKVQLVVVLKSNICGAHIVMEGEDFIACGASPTGCEKFTHKGKKPEYYVDHPLEDTEAFAIHM